MRDPSEGLGGDAAIRQVGVAVDCAAGAHGASASSGAGGAVADDAGSVVVRRAVTADRDGVVRLAEVVDAGERLDALVADPYRSILVAELRSKIVGLAEAQFYGVALRRAFGVVRLHDLVVDRRYRRRGIGSLLVDEIERWALSIPECRYLEWQSSQPAVAFYEARGLKANEFEDSSEHPYFVVDIGSKRAQFDKNVIPETSRQPESQTECSS